jgi:hypothetical protein
MKKEPENVRAAFLAKERYELYITTIQIMLTKLMTLT